MNLKRQLLAVLLVAFCFAAGAQTEVTQGYKVPRLTTDERNTISVSGNSFANGQVVYNTDNNCLEFWNGTDWVSLCDKGATTPPEVKLIDPDTLLAGEGNFIGRTCFDVAQTTCEGTDASTRAANKTDFTNRAVQTYAAVAPYSGVQTYTFTATAANVSNVRYQIQVTAGSFAAADLIDAATPLTDTLEAGALAVDASVDLIVHYKSDLNAALSGKDRDNASKFNIYIIYYDGEKDVKVELNVNLQDCACCGCNGVATAMQIGSYSYLTHEYMTEGVMRCWMVENLQEVPADATPDPAGSGSSIVAQYWTTYNSGANSGRGYYYNWLAAQNACPAGWSLPTQTQLVGANVTGDEGIFTTLSNPATVGRGFWYNATVLAGYRSTNGAWNSNWGTSGAWWCRTSGNTLFADSNDTFNRYTTSSTALGISVRCIKKETND